MIAGASEPSLLFIPPAPGAPNGTLLAVTGGRLPCEDSGSLHESPCPGATLLLRRSADRGATWSPVSLPFLNFSNPTTVGDFFQNQLTWDSGIDVVLLTIGNITFDANTCNGPHSSLEDADGMLVVRSTDRGKTWGGSASLPIAVPRGYAFPAVHAIGGRAVPSRGRFVAGGSADLFVDLKMRSLLNGRDTVGIRDYDTMVVLCETVVSRSFYGRFWPIRSSWRTIIPNAMSGAP